MHVQRSAAATHPPARYLWAWLGYLGLTLLMLLPLLPSFASAVAGGPVAQRDSWQNIWNLWWVQQALASGQNPFRTPLLYYPEGTQLYLQTLNITNGILVAPITGLFGPIAGYNSAVLIAFSLTGLGGYALALRLSGDRFGAFLGGLALTFSPFHMTKLWDGQLEMIALQWAPWYLFFLVRAVEVRRLRDALLAGICLALIGYTSWYYFLFFAIASVIVALIWLASSAKRLTILLYLAVVAITGAVLLVPILLPALRSVSGGDEPPDPFAFLKVIHSADLVDFWLPNALHPLWGASVTRYAELIHPYVAAWNVALGYTTLALALVGAFAYWKLAWRWWALALVSIVLALGPLLQINGSVTSIPLPYALLAYLPGVDIAHRPNHFVVIAVIALAPLVGLGVAALRSCMPSPRHANLLSGGIALVLVFELLPPIWPIFRSQPHPAYAQLAGQAGAIIDLPPRLESSEPLEAQLVHGRPMMGGYVSRTPAYPFGVSMPFVRDLWAMAELDRVIIPYGGAQDDLADEALNVLNAYDLRHVVVHWRYFSAETRPAMQQALALALPGVAPSYEDEQLSIYTVPQQPARPFAYLRDQWYGEEREGQRRWRWMGERAEVVLVNPNQVPTSVTLTLVAQSAAEQTPVALSFRGAAVQTRLVQRADTPVRLTLLLPPGESSLWLEAPTVVEGGRSQRRLSIVLTAAWLS